ncbi:YraN family protein [Candidatus Dependentiae bacterium]|nr:YraN family protein [Candidatus Dependentiae bacterium]
MSTKSKAAHLQTGTSGENSAALFLQKQGFSILCQNYKTSRGEIDIIAQQDNLIAFVEVKTRKTAYFHSSLLITRDKQRKISLAARQYIQEQSNLTNIIFRFDVVFVYPQENAVEFEYIPNAFYAQD